ncbi:phosphoadenylyl-sulfate reductase [Candidatus Methylomirabilis sp.]|uniref:phosphoadenylyl-sulfate reductase n=1 Tax=Candidatus Methylomirabilis sp. TaxID=2032687 RepID=UPI0030761D32
MERQSGIQSIDGGSRVLSAESIVELNERFRTAGPEVVLRWAIDTFAPKLALASSFGAEDMVLIDMLSKLEPATTIFTLDTGRLHEETYDVMERAREQYKVTIESYFPGRDAVEALERERGFYSFRQSIEERKFCCRVRKVEPLGRALKSVDAWITGLRREQAATRTGIDAVEIDASHGSIVKINPLVEWTEPQVWAYIREHHVPYNALHDQGFPSIGCAPCTRAITPGEDVRAGRWWWENPETKECGLHLDGKQGAHGTGH